jgi:hypothetical protein
VVFCAVVEAVVLVDGFTMIAVAGVDVDETVEVEEVLAAVDAGAVVAAFDVVEAVEAVEAVEEAALPAAAGAAVVTAAGVAGAEPLEVELVVAGEVVELVAAAVVGLSDASDEPQPLSAEQHATRPICTPIKTFPTLDTIVTHFRFCRVDGRHAGGFRYEGGHAIQPVLCSITPLLPLTHRKICVPPYDGFAFNGAK